MEHISVSPARSKVADTVRSGVVGLARTTADVLAIVAGFAVSYDGYVAMIDAGWLERPMPTVPPYVTIVSLFALLMICVFVRMGLYQRRASILNLWELQTVVKGIGFTSVLLFTVLFFMRLTGYARLLVIGGIGMTIIFAILERRTMAMLLGALYQRPRWTHRVLICGCGSTGQLLMKKIVQAPQLGWTVVGFLDDWARIGGAVTCRVTQGGPVLFEASVLGRLRQLAEVASRHDIDEVLVTMPNVPETLQELVEIARNRKLRFGAVPHLQDARADQLVIEDVSAIPVLRSSAPARRVASDILKRFLDLLVAPLIAVVTAPLWLLAIVAIRWDSPGGILFVQNRIGRSGRPFRMLKFRTMWSDAPAYQASPHGDDCDPRITRSGRILRMTGIDELPQLLNVITGDMSMVGPRPEMPFLVNRYGPIEKQRLLVKPGVTGLWQLGADRHAEIHENLEYDLYYLTNRSLLLDCLILLETVFFTFTQVARALRPRRAEPVATTSSATFSEVEPYLLVALDQRGRASMPESWHRWLGHLHATAPPWAVKILVARQNVSHFHSLLEESRKRIEEFVDRIELVVFESRSEMRAHVAGAELVLTELHNVAEWAEELGVGVIRLSEGAPHSPNHRRASDEVVHRGAVADDPGVPQPQRARLVSEQRPA